ncbi:hypothetical protein F4814DRAFT_402293 [Daldinia grandis]|nr:hypothetical protein F4814DRAFT_402293 [Daldinia grandis]
MALPSLETQAKVASEAAQSFIDHFYEALSKRRPINGFYASTSARLTAGGVRPDISINGQPVADVPAYEALLEAQGGPVAYDVASFDAQPVNPCYRIAEPDPQPPAGAAAGRDATAAAAVRNGDRLSFALQVSGVVRYGRGHGDGKGEAVAGGAGAGAADGGGKNDEPLEKPFNEAFLLVPHWEAWGRNASRGLRKWVIVSQNFRAL